MPLGDTPVILYQRLLDVHDEFDQDLGIFTATLPGIYVFMFSFPNSGTDPASAVTVRLQVNGITRSAVTSLGSADRITQYAGTTTVLDLVAGDQVRLIAGGGLIAYVPVNDAGVAFLASPITFSGFLL